MRRSIKEKGATEIVLLVLILLLSLISTGGLGFMIFNFLGPK